MTKEEAKEWAKDMRKFLSPGERKYFRIKYTPVLACDVKEDK